jgi:uncharacterized phage protein (TIGR01671 family)
MREIKFRGKRIYNGEWIYGDLLTERNKASKHSAIVFYVGHMLPSAESVSKETIGQYTGLLDKNGKEIYDGDIIKQSSNFCIIERCIGGYDCQILHELKNGDMIKGSVYNFSFLSEKYCEIIDNIYYTKIQIY